MNIVSPALMAGKIAEDAYADGLRTATKSDGTPVTSGDLRVSDFLQQHQKLYYPDHVYLGEENQSGNPDATDTYTVDEIDGTSAYAQGGKDCAVVIGLTQGNNFVSAVINNFRAAGCFATDTQFVWHIPPRGRAQLVKIANQKPRPKRVAICTWHTAPHRLMEVSAILKENSFIVEHPGGIASQAGRIVLGEIDCVLFPGANKLPDGRVTKNSWHEAGPMSLIINNAGGQATDLRGSKLDYDRVIRPNGYPDFQLRCGFAASRDSNLHEEVLEIIAPFLED